MLVVPEELMDVHEERSEAVIGVVTRFTAMCGASIVMCRARCSGLALDKMDVEFPFVGIHQAPPHVSATGTCISLGLPQTYSAQVCRV